VRYCGVMGYTSTVHDNEDILAIRPPLNHAEVKKFPESAGTNFTLVTQRKVIETDTGTLTVWSASALTLTDPYQPSKRYDLVKELQEVVELYPDHEFSGFFELIGEDGVIWRVRVDSDRKVMQVFPKLTWPEEF